MTRRRTRKNPPLPSPPKRPGGPPSPQKLRSALARVRGINLNERERPFNPERPGTWRGSSRDLVVNGIREGILSDGTRTIVYHKPGSLDEYTVVPHGMDWDAMERGGMRPMLATSKTGSGFSEWTEGQEGRHLGRKVGWKELPEQLRAHIEARVLEQHDNSSRSMVANGSMTIKGVRLDPFTVAFLEAALFSSNDESRDDGGDPLDDNYSIHDFTKESLQELSADCERFQQENARDLEVGDDEQAGHDFWLNRNGHGAGFWDGDWPEPQASRLDEASQRFGEVNLYVQDGEVGADLMRPVARNGRRQRRNGEVDPRDIPAHLRGAELREEPEHNGQDIGYSQGMRGRSAEWFQVEYATGSDYSGGSVNESNYKVLGEMLDEHHPEDAQPVVWACTSGGHGTYGIVVRYADLEDEVREAIDALEDYALMDEEAHSRLEMEQQGEAWENWGRSEFIEALAKELGVDEDELEPLITPDQWYAVFDGAREAANEYWEDQQGDGQYIDMKRVAKKAGSVVNSGKMPQYSNDYQDDAFEALIAALPEED